MQRKAGVVGRLKLAGWHQAGLVLADGDLVAATAQVEAGAGVTTSDGERGETQAAMPPEQIERIAEALAERPADLPATAGKIAVCGFMA